MTARAAAPVIRTPDQRVRAFVSSTLGELADERAAVREAISHLHLAPVLFELGARPHPPRDLYRAYLDQSHIFIGIYWQSYGWVAPGEEVSGLEDEYRLAGDKPKLIYVKAPAPDRETRLRGLLDGIRSDDTVSYKRFSSAGELRELVEDDLMVLLSERFEAPVERSRPNGTVTFLFVDIDGGSELAEHHPAEFPEVLVRYQTLLHQAAEAHEGFVFHVFGGAFCAAFHTALDAIEAALDGQRLLGREPWAPVPVTARMGINTGMARGSGGGDRSGGYTGCPALTRAQRIMSTAHGGQVLLSNSSAEQVSAALPEGVSLRDLGQHRLNGGPHAERLWQVLAPDLTQSFPVLATPGSGPSNLPVALNRFVGRTHEIEEVKDRVARSRLLTLVGPGGTGKTRLALQAATDLREHFEDRVFFIDLASSRDLDSVLSVIARTIGVQEESNRPLDEQLKAQIGTQRMLLLLDNFEHVTVAAPTMVGLLQVCPGLTELVTSREPLRVNGEQVFPVPPLTLPASDLRHVSVESLARSEAVELFVERAMAIRPEFRLTEENARAVAELCVRLDGLPLAIELVTGRLGLLSPQALVQRLENRLRLLQGGARDLPVRQQTLRDTIAWSYEMLDSGERRLFQLLSVFSGATLEAVEAVASQVVGLDDIDVLDTLSSLVDKSLVRHVRRDDATARSVMLETVREFAVARLAEDPGLQAAAVLEHAAYFAEWTRSQWEHLTGDGRETSVHQMAADLENIRTAWDYWVAAGNFEQLSKLTDSLWLLYDARGWYHATLALTTDLLGVLSSAPSTPERILEQITLQTGLARVLLALKGYTREVEAAYVAALDLCEGRGEIPELLPVLRGLSSLYMLRAEFEKGARAGEQILRLAERYHDAGARVEGHLVLGANLAFLNRLREGVEHLERGIEAYESTQHGSARLQLGNNPGVVCFTTSALVLWMLGHPDRARDRAAAAIDLASRLNHPSSMAYAQFHTGLLHLWRREDESAHICAQAVQDIAEENELPVWGAVGACLRGAAMAGLGAADEGLTLIERAMSTYQRLRTPPVFWPILLYLQAGGCGAAGRPQDGLPLVDEAMQVAMNTPGRTLWPEFCQLKGDLLLALSPDNADEAESLFQQAADVAAELDAPMLQLRAAVRLGRLWHGQGKSEQARQLLSEAHARFTEGFATADLRDAVALLEDVGLPRADGSPIGRPRQSRGGRQ